MPRSRALLLCDLEGNIIKEFASGTDICTYFQVMQPALMKYLNGKATVFRGAYLICYKDQYVDKEQMRQFKFSKRMIVVLKRTTNEVLGYFNCIEDAATYLGAHKHTVGARSLIAGTIGEYRVVKFEDYDKDFDYTVLDNYKRKTRVRKKVVEIGDDNEIINEWDNCGLAAKAVFVSRERMNEVCKKKTFVTVGRIFTFKEDYDPKYDYNKYRFITPDGMPRRGGCF